MNWINILRRWTARSIHTMIFGAALVGPASINAFAQGPASVVGKMPNRNFTRSLSFDLPVDMSTEDRVSIGEIRLYMRTPGTNWKVQEVGPQFVTRFSCKAPQEGEYWYSLVIVDRNNRMTPPDVSLLPPQQRVVVDTTPPILQVQPLTTQDGGYYLRCTLEDLNADPTSLKAVHKTETGDVALESVPGQIGMFRVKSAEWMRFPVVVVGMDLARNVATKEVNVRELFGLTAHTSQMPANTLPSTSYGGMRPDPGAGVLPPPRADVPPHLAKADPPQRFDTPPRGDPPKTEAALFPGLPSRIDLPTPPSLGPSLNSPSSNPPVQEQQTARLQHLVTEPTVKNGLPYQLINTTHASVEYRIDHVGPSGVGKVEIYMTPDDGQTWHRLGEDPDKRSPADINLPGDGVYGIRIAISNGNGFGGRAPIRGDAPHCKVEVDTTSPFVQLRSTEVMATAGHVEIRWNATDKNLGANPVNLFYRTRLDGPWQIVAQNVKNDGIFNWGFPRESSPQFFFKIEVADQAGNVAFDTSRQPVVIDMTEPRATVVGVSGSSTVKIAPGQ